MAKSTNKNIGSEIDHSELFFSLPVGVIYQSDDGRVITANQAAEKIFGMHLRQMTGKDLADPVWKAVRSDGTDFPGDELPAMVALRTGKPARNVVMGVFNPQTNSHRWIIADSVPQFKPRAKKPYQVYTTFVDFTERKSAEEELELTGTRFRGFWDSAPDAMITVNSKGLITLVNAKVTELFGYRPEELIDKPIEILIPDQFKTRHVENRNNYFATPHTRAKGVKFSLSGRKIDGTSFPAEITLSYYKIDNQLFALAAIRDISDRKQIEQDLVQSEERYRTFVEGTHDLIQDVRADGKIISVNETWKKTLGYTEEQIEKLNLFDIIHPDSLDHCKAVFSKIMQGEFIPVLSAVLKDINGKKVYLEGTAITRAENNKIISTHTFFRDVTEKKVAEEALRESERLFANSFENASIGIALVGIDGRWLKVNKAVCNLTGYTEEELMSKTFQDITFADDLYSDLANITRLLANETQSYQMEKRYITKRGDIVWVMLSVTLMRDDNAVPLYFISQIQDINERKVAEEALRASEEKYRSLVETTDAIIAVFDGRGNLLFANGSAIRNLEIPAEKISGGNILDLMPEPEASSLLRKIREVITSAKGIVLESKMKLAGETKWYRTSIQPVKDASGSVSFAIINSVDVSAIIQTEEALISSENKLKALINSQTSYVIRTNLQGNYTYWNPKFNEDFGWLHEGKDLTKIKATATVSPHHHNRMDEVSLKCIQNPGKVFKVELDKPTIDGGIRTSLWEFICVTDAAGTPSEIQCMGFDITDRKKAESDLINERAFLNRMVESAPEAIVVCDAEERILRLNDEFVKLFGYTAEDAIGRYINDLIVPQYKTEEGKLATFHATKGEHLNLETVRRTKDNKLVDVMVSIAPVFVAGRQLGIIGIYRNVSDNKRMLKDLITAKEKAEEMNKIKTYFFANMSHELRTPFVGILGFSELLSETVEDPENKELVDGIIKSSQRMMDTLNKILALTRLEFEPPKMKENEVDLKRLIEENVKLFEQPAHQKSLTYQLHNLEEPYIVKTDGKILSEVIINLLSNAVKFTHVGGIRISAIIRSQGYYKSLIIRVSDTGIGIPKEKHNVIWQEFRQVSEGLSRNFEGTGLGLTITHKYVGILGGTIEVDSEPRKGSTFTFEMPLKEYSEEEKSAETGAQEQAGAPVKVVKSVKKLLLVEDDDYSQRFIKAALSKHYDVEILRDAESALEKVRFNHYDAFLLDINLRYGLDGVGLMEALRTIPEYEYAPMIAVTAYAAETDRKEFLARGFSAYISKPFTQASLLNLLHDLFLQQKEG